MSALPNTVSTGESLAEELTGQTLEEMVQEQGYDDVAGMTDDSLVDVLVDVCESYGLDPASYGLPCF